MKKRHYISLAVVVAGLAFCAVLLVHPRQLPLSECSEVYQKYKDVEGVDASFIKDFPANDSVSVDVTLLKAQDSTTWANLVIELCHDGNCEDFLLGEIFFKPIPKEDAEKIPNDELKNDYIIISCLSELTIGIFHLENVQQQKTIIDRYINNLIIKN